VWEYGGNVRKLKKGSGAVQDAQMGGAFRLVDSINEYARQRGFALAGLRE
jgi:hypothetical protein